MEKPVKGSVSFLEWDTGSHHDGRKSGGGGGQAGGHAPTILKVGDIISNVPPPPLFLGWMIINWNEDPFYMFSDVRSLVWTFFVFCFFACQKFRFVMYDGCLENWGKNIESEKKCRSPPPPPRSSALNFRDLRDSRGWRRTEKPSVSPPPPPHHDPLRICTIF